MVLKDWKKIGKDEWQNRKDEKTILYITKEYTSKIKKIIADSNSRGDTGHFIQRTNRKSTGRYVLRSYGNAPFNSFLGNPKVFKTKTQALKYARAYMRSH